MIFGAILAGGVGSRMNISDMPKQFLPLGDKPILVHTLEKFLLCERLDMIYIGVHPNWVLHMEDLLDKYVPARRPASGSYRAAETEIRLSSISLKK